MSSARKPKAVPAARALARAHGLDLAAITGTGPRGLILKRDVEQALAKTRSSPSVPPPTHLAAAEARLRGVELDNLEGSGPRGRVVREDVLKAAGSAPTSGPVPVARTQRMSSMRKAIARRMSTSAFTAPHIHFFVDLDMEPVMGLVGQLRGEFDRRWGVKLSVNDLILKAVALALRDVPVLNAFLEGEEIRYWAEVNVGLAVAVEGGLVVPAIRRVDERALHEIARERAELVELARAGRLVPEHWERGTFTVSSLASFGVQWFTAIINPPQAAILSVGATREAPVVRGGKVVPGRVATFGLGVDHRIADGAVAGRFLSALAGRLSNPAVLVV